MKSLIVLGVFLAVLARCSLIEDVDCADITDSLTEEICGVQQLLKLYQRRLTMLKAMREQQQSSSPLAFRTRRHTAIPKRANSNYTFDAEFVPPSFVVSNGSLYDINGNYLQNVPGQVLVVQAGEMTTLLGKQVNIVHLKSKISKELWGFQKEHLPTLWTMYKGERMMVQYQRNVIEFTSKQLSKRVEVNEPILKLLRTPTMLLFICQHEYGKVSMVTLEPNYLKPSNPLQLSSIVSAAVDPHNWQTFVLLNDKHVLFLLDVRTGNVVKELDISQTTIRNQFSSPKVALLANIAYVFSRNSPKLLVYNMTYSSSIVEEPSLMLCPSSNNDIDSNYDHKFSLSGESIYILCSRNSTRDNVSQLFEIQLHEHKAEELVPKWLQYLMIVVAIGFGVFYRKYHNQQSTQTPKHTLPDKKSKYTVGKPISELDSESDPETTSSVNQFKQMAHRSKKSPKDSKPGKKLI